MSILTSALGASKLFVKRNAPELLLVAGLAAGAAAIVVACKETIKAADILEEHKTEMEKIHEGKELIEKGEVSEEDYSVEDNKKDTFIVYSKTCVGLAKTYAPAAVLAAISAAAILTSHGMMRKRLFAATAAYASLDSLFKKYRARVVEEQGEIMDRHYRYGTKLEQIKVVDIDDEGKKTTRKETIEVLDKETADLGSPWAFFFDADNPHWEKDVLFNRNYLTQIEVWANEQINKYGFLTVYELLRHMGYEPDRHDWMFSEESLYWGWVREAEGTENDGYFHWAFLDMNTAAHEPTILLDLNCSNIRDCRVMRKLA